MGNSSTDDYATTGDGSCGDTPPLNSSIYSEGEKVLAYHGKRIYDAKASHLSLYSPNPHLLFKSLSSEIKNGFTSFTTFWDEWVGVDRLLKQNEENIIRQQTLAKQPRVDDSTKSGQLTQMNPKSSAVGKERKRKNDSGTEDTVSLETIVKNQVPSIVRRQVIDNPDFVSQPDKVHMNYSILIGTKWSDTRSFKHFMQGLPNYTVQKAELRKNEWRYFVHYLKCSFVNNCPFQKGLQKSLLWLGHLANSWDEWVGGDRLLKHTEDNILKQQALDKKQGVDKNTKSGRSAQTKPKISTDVKAEKEDHKNNVTKGKKRKNDSGTEDTAALEKLVKIQIPSTLRKQLVDDWEFVSQQDKLVILPRSPTVDDILQKYLDYRTKKDGKVTDPVGEILKGIRCYFDRALPVMLLYKKERKQYVETVVGDVSPSTIYGAEHLLRLFGPFGLAFVFLCNSDIFLVSAVKLPELLAYVNIEEETQSRLQQKLLDFLKFMQKNQSTFFLSAYDGPKSVEGKGKGKT
ncbi:unnamed protein product [Malus baccata var. baccata]